MTRRQRNDLKKSLRRVAAHATGTELRTVAIPQTGARPFYSGDDAYADTIKLMAQESYVGRKYQGWVEMGSRRKFGE